ASINASCGAITGVAVGSTVITYHVGPGCTSTSPIDGFVLSPTSGDTVICQSYSSTLRNTASVGTCSRGNTNLTTVDVNTVVVYGVMSGNAPITYAIPGGCYAMTNVTVNPSLPITGTPSLCQRRAITTLSNAVSDGTWSISNTSIATIEPTTGIVHGVSG